MTEMILPGTYIEVRDEGLISAGRVTVGNLGVIGTASKGPIGEPIILGGYNEAVSVFGQPGPWHGGGNNELTLVRALRLAFAQGATTVFAVRVANLTSENSPAKAAFVDINLVDKDDPSETGTVTITAKSPGTWANGLSVETRTSGDFAFVENQKITIPADVQEVVPITIEWPNSGLIKNARNKITLNSNQLVLLYGEEEDPGPGQVSFKKGDDSDPDLLVFGEPVSKNDTVVVSYAVSADQATEVVFRLGEDEEVYRVVSGADLKNDLARDSQWVEVTKLDEVHEEKKVTVDESVSLSKGSDGAETTVLDYQAGLDALLDVAAHIIVAAGQDESFGSYLAAHCKLAATDARQRERIAVVGTGLQGTGPGQDVLDRLRQHQLNSDRLIFVGPGIHTGEGVLPGAYTAASVAGLLAAMDAHISPTNKVLDVPGLERVFTRAELAQIVQARAFVVEQRLGTRIVKGITTSTNTAWHQITTRRIVDFAKFGVRSAANPFIGKLNNERVRQALKGSINGFLADMVLREMLVTYELEVTATREQQIRGEAHVAITLQPTFSIDFIRVVMTLQ